MKRITKKLALLALPIALYLAFFVAFEPNNYFGLHKTTSSSAPIALIRAFRDAPGERLIIGDSRFAQFDPEIMAAASGKQWQNLAFGGASLKESLDLAEYVLAQSPDVKEIVFGLSFYTLNAGYDTDRMAGLEATLQNPLAYLFNLEYNINTLTNFGKWTAWVRQRLAGTTDWDWAEAQREHETGTWQYPADYTGPDGTVYPVHTALAVYPATIAPKCANWSLSPWFGQLPALAEACRARGIRLTVVLAPMADNVLAEVCEPYGIAEAMRGEVLPQLNAWAEEYGFAVLDYEWADRPALDNDTQFYDGFHLDVVYGLPAWTETLFAALADHTA